MELIPNALSYVTRQQIRSGLFLKEKAVNYFYAGLVFWTLIGLIIYALRPNSALSRELLGTNKRWSTAVIASAAAGCILVSVLPMSVNPYWTSEKRDHLTQYEVMAESILDGRVDLDYGDVDSRLLELENPYDPEARREAGLSFDDFRWDHALYNGKYYMYFGVVPVFLLFLPYRIITGTSLTTYHATQIFTAVIIVCFFALFYSVARKFLRKMSVSVYLALSAAASLMSVWYFSAAPSLYCTAISAGVCMEMGSLFLFFKACFPPEGERRQISAVTWGSVLGALSFGCRPTVALVNFLLVPMLIYRFIKQKQMSGKVCTALILPYAVTAILLMYYNYIRFDSPFEFGTTYQLTVIDQVAYSNEAKKFGFLDIVNGLIGQFFWNGPLQNTFPYVILQSVFFNFPICFAASFCLIRRRTLVRLRKTQLLWPVAALLATQLLITTAQVYNSPYRWERYRTDIYWLAGLILFAAFGFFLETVHHRRQYGFMISLLALFTIFQCFLYWLHPYDSSFTQMYPEYLQKFERVFTLNNFRPTV